jgi:hypothetical protein
MNATTTEAAQVKRMNRVLVKTAATLGRDDARYLVSAYYAVQRHRESAEAQLRSAAGGSQPHELIAWLAEQDRVVEKQIKRALDEWTDALPAARWAKSIIGVGPVISAGLAAHIDISKCRTVSQIWRFAGYDPTLKWACGTKCPWNPHLKHVCGLAGESFVKTSGHEDGFYGRFYLARKRVEQGKLPPAQIHVRAMRGAVKLFLAHYYYVAWVAATGAEPPKPYAMEILGHDGFIAPPNFQQQPIGDEGHASNGRDSARR